MPGLGQEYSDHTLIMRNKSRILILPVSSLKSGFGHLGKCLHMLGVDALDASHEVNETRSGTVQPHSDRDTILAPVTAKDQEGIQESATDLVTLRHNRLLLHSWEGALGFIVDPHITNTFHLWTHACEELSIDLRLIHLIRHPWEACISSSASIGIDLAEASRHWLQGVRAAYWACRRHRHSLLTFDQLLADPISSLSRINRELGLELPVASPGMQQALLNHVQPSLKHVHAGQMPESDRALLRHHLRIYHAFRQSQVTTDYGSRLLEIDAASCHGTGDFFGEQHGQEFRSIGQQLEHLLSQEPPRHAHPGQGGHAGLQDKVAAKTQPPAPCTIQIGLPMGNRGLHVVKATIQTGAWQDIQANISRCEHLLTSPLEVRIPTHPATVRISSLRLINRATGAVLSTAPLADQAEAVGIHGLAFRLPDPEQLVLAQTGAETYLSWLGLKIAVDCPMALEVRLRVDQGVDLSGLTPQQVAPVLRDLLRGGRFADVLNLLDEHPGLDVLETRDPEVLTWLIRLLSESDRLFQASELYISAIQAKLPIRVLPLTIGKRLEDHNYLEEADAFYVAACEYHSGRIDVHLARCRVLFALDRSKEAREVAEQALGKFPKSAVLRMELAAQELEQGGRKLALEYIQTGQKLNYDYPLWANRAVSALTRNVVDVHGVRLLVPREVVSPDVLLPILRGGYERSEMMFIKNVIQPGDRVLELGGGIGFLAIYIQKHIPDVEVCTVEANPALIPVIRKNLDLNNCTATVMHGLAADRDSEADFNVSVNFWSSSVLDIPSEYTTQKVPTLNTNRLIQEFKPNKMIIDIEGGEVDLIPRLNLQGVEKIIIEVHQRYTGMEGVSTVFQSLLNRNFMADLDHTRVNVYTFVKSTTLHNAQGR